MAAPGAPDDAANILDIAVLVQAITSGQFLYNSSLAGTGGIGESRVTGSRLKNKRASGNGTMEAASVSTGSSNRIAPVGSRTETFRRPPSQNRLDTSRESLPAS